MEPSTETLRKTAYLALVDRAVPLQTKAVLKRGGVRCRMHLPKRRVPPGTRRILVLSWFMAELSFEIVPPGNVNVLLYRPGEWETALDEQYQRAVNLFGEPPEPWLSFFSKPDRSLKASSSRKLLNVLLWPFGLYASTTERQLRISWRLTPWRIFFWIISVIGTTSIFIDQYFGNTRAAVAFGLIASFLGSLAFSFKTFKHYQSPSYIEALKHMKNNVQRLVQLIAHHRDKVSLVNAQEVLTLSTPAWKELHDSRNVQKIEMRFRQTYATVLFWARIWAALRLASSGECSLILFEELLIHPARHRYLLRILGHPKSPAIKQLAEPTTWVEPLISLANLFSEVIDETLKRPI